MSYKLKKISDFKNFDVVNVDGTEYKVFFHQDNPDNIVLVNEELEEIKQIDFDLVLNHTVTGVR